MNFKTVSHLLKGDWQLLRLLVFPIWGIMLLGALPWYLDSPHDYTMPFQFFAAWTDDLRSAPSDFQAQPIGSTTLSYFQKAAYLLAMLLASMLGLMAARRPLIPVRRRESLAAVAIFLGVCIVLPHGLLAAGSLWRQGFALTDALAAAATSAVSAGLLLGICTMLAVWWPTRWHLLATWGVLLVLVHSLDPTIWGIWTLPILPGNLVKWLPAVLAVGVMAMSFPNASRRFSVRQRAVMILALASAAWWGGARLSNDLAAPPRGAAVLRPVAENVSLRRELSSGTTSGSTFSLRANFTVANLPPGHGVQWDVIGGSVSLNDRNLGEVHGTGHAGFRQSNDEIAAAAVLPGRVAEPGDGQFGLPSDAFQPAIATVHLPAGTVLPPDRDAQLDLRLLATLYRYEVAVDVPLRFQPTRVDFDGSPAWVRKLPDGAGALSADVRILQADSPVQAKVSPFAGARWFFRLPVSGRILEAKDFPGSASGPVFSGARWYRCSGRWRDPDPEGAPGREGQMDTSGVRLILLRPVIVSQTVASVSAPLARWADGEWPRFYDTIRTHVDPVVYRRDLFPRRPDPQTCSREDFLRWLPIPASLFYGAESGEVDLATYAPRFAGLMAHLEGSHTIAGALRIGTPESRKQEILEKIAHASHPSHLVEVAGSRGWLDDVRPDVLRRFHQGDLELSPAVMELEDPGSYPEMISRFLENPAISTYEQLRLLPGMEPMLRREVDLAAKAAKDSRTTFPAGGMSERVYGAHLYAAKQGGSEALERVLAMYADGSRDHQTIDLSYLLKIPPDWSKRPDLVLAWLEDHKASSLRYDPLSRIWKPLP